MNPRKLHQEAMNFSFQAKEALLRGDDSEGYDLYTRAAELEAEVAKFYYDKPDLEPTRGMARLRANMERLTSALAAGWPSL